MTPVILDDGLRAKLNGLNAVVPVCEPTGETIGQFVPQEQYLAFVYAQVRDAVPAAELDAAAAAPGGRRLADIRRDRLGGA